MGQLTQTFGFGKKIYWIRFEFPIPKSGFGLRLYYHTKIDLPMQLLPDATDAKIRVEFQLKNMNHQRI